jgi:hypothetical protein
VEPEFVFLIDHQNRQYMTSIKILGLISSRVILFFIQLILVLPQSCYLPSSIHCFFRQQSLGSPQRNALHELQQLRELSFLEAIEVRSE